MPKYMTEIFEGNLVEEYYDSNKDHDVIFLVTVKCFQCFACHIMISMGLVIFVVAQQLIWQSYYLLEEH